MAVTKQKTLGESRVRIDFNVTANGNVDLIKKQTAELINICETLKAINPHGEKSRALATAQTKYEEAAMWAVKGATFVDESVTVPVKATKKPAVKKKK